MQHQRETFASRFGLLMTMIGGKIEHLVPSLAGELGKQPTGAAVELGGPEANY